MTTILLISLITLCIIEVLHIACSLVILHLKNKIKKQRKKMTDMFCDYATTLHPEFNPQEIICVSFPGDKPVWKLYITLEQAIQQGWTLEKVDG